jgi:hypothetical protein
MIVRESIYAALWNIASGAAKFATANRRLRHWTDVAPAEMPALFMAEKGATATSKAFGTPQEYRLQVDLFIYVHSSDPYLAPASILNPLIDAIELALAPSPVTGLQQLGLEQMVRHARIEGHIQTDEGVLSDLAIAIVPVEVLCL